MRPWKKPTSVSVMKLIDIQKTTTMAINLGTKVRVISWIEVSAWKRPTPTPATSAAVRIGTEVTVAIHRPWRSVS